MCVNWRAVLIVDRQSMLMHGRMRIVELLLGEAGQPGLIGRATLERGEDLVLPGLLQILGVCMVDRVWYWIWHVLASRHRQPSSFLPAGLHVWGFRIHQAIRRKGLMRVLHTGHSVANRADIWLVTNSLLLEEGSYFQVKELNLLIHHLS